MQSICRHRARWPAPGCTDALLISRHAHNTLSDASRGFVLYLCAWAAARWLGLSAFAACSDVTMPRERGDSPSRRCHRLRGLLEEHLDEFTHGRWRWKGGARRRGGGVKRPVRAEIGRDWREGQQRDWGVESRGEREAEIDRGWGDTQRRDELPDGLNNYFLCSCWQGCGPRTELYELLLAHFSENL